MTDEFRDCFVGEKGYDVLKTLLRDGNQFCQDAAKCFQERSDAEIAYTRALRKTSDTLQRLAGQTKGTSAQAFATLATETGKEAIAHNLVAQTLVNDISMPLKNLAENQVKERKLIEDILNRKFKEWNAQKENDLKYRARQIEKCREIETAVNRISEVSNSGKSSSRSKANSVSTPLVMSCVPIGRYASLSDKSTSQSDVKQYSHLEASVKKAEEDLEKIDRKYHSSTKEVELSRQICDLEMQRSCDQLQKMELSRITEIDHFVKTYTASIQTLSETMRQITQDLYSIQISPMTDILVQARSNVQPAELEVLLYDIYAENKDNVMSEQRRILSLMKWIELLKRDIEIQQQMKGKSSPSASSSSISHTEKSNEEEEDDDGAMCSHTKKDVVRKPVRRERSSSSSNDEDGGMSRSKHDKKKNEGIKEVSTEVFVDRRGAVLLEHLYRASLYKIECIYNRLKRLPEPTYEHSQRLTKTYTEKGCPTTFLRLPIQSSIAPPASAPLMVHSLNQALPTAPSAIYLQQSAPYPMTRQAAMPVVYAVQQQAPPGPGWAVNGPVSTFATSANHDPQHFVYPPLHTVCLYPTYLQSAPPPRCVRALYSYEAKHTDELDLKPGDLVAVLERRQDDWFKGDLRGRVGLFPGNYVEEV